MIILELILIWKIYIYVVYGNVVDDDNVKVSDVAKIYQYSKGKISSLD